MTGELWGPPEWRPPDNTGQLHGIVVGSLKSAVVVLPALILTWRACGCHPSRATINDSGLLRRSSRSAYPPLASVFKV